MEIERKFLVNDDINNLIYQHKQIIEDIYLTDNLRLRNKNNQWILTYKQGSGISRQEIEIELGMEPLLFSKEIKLKKTRLIIPYLNQNFEVNIFDDILYKGTPLILIELELSSVNQVINKPEWLGEEVTEDERFYGYNLYKLLKYRDFDVK